MKCRTRHKEFAISVQSLALSLASTYRKLGKRRWKTVRSNYHHHPKVLKRVRRSSYFSYFKDVHKIIGLIM